MSKCLSGESSSTFCCLFSFYCNFFSVAALVVWKYLDIFAFWHFLGGSHIDIPKLLPEGWKCVQGSNSEFLLHVLEYCRSYMTLNLLASNSLRLLGTYNEMEVSKIKKHSHFLRCKCPKLSYFAVEWLHSHWGIFIVVFTIRLFSFLFKSTNDASWHKECL